jgi:hypothetical protein
MSLHNVVSENFNIKSVCAGSSFCSRTCINEREMNINFLTAFFFCSFFDKDRSTWLWGRGHYCPRTSHKSPLRSTHKINSKPDLMDTRLNWNKCNGNRGNNKTKRVSSTRRPTNHVTRYGVYWLVNLTLFLLSGHKEHVLWISHCMTAVCRLTGSQLYRQSALTRPAKWNWSGLGWCKQSTNQTTS